MDQPTSTGNQPNPLDDYTVEAAVDTALGALLRGIPDGVDRYLATTQLAKRLPWVRALSVAQEVANGRELGDIASDLAVSRQYLTRILAEHQLAGPRAVQRADDDELPAAWWYGALLRVGARMADACDRGVTGTPARDEWTKIEYNARVTTRLRGRVDETVARWLRKMARSRSAEAKAWRGRWDEVAGRLAELPALPTHLAPEQQSQVMVGYHQHRADWDDE